MSSIRFFGPLALAVALAVPAAALAQQAPMSPAPGAAAPAETSPHGEHKHHGQRGKFRAALNRLNLSDAQKTQIQQAFTQAREANKTADPATRKANREKLHAQIEGFLTPAQRTQLQAELTKGRVPAQR